MTNTDIASATSIMLGTTQASAVYIGSTLIWTATEDIRNLEYITNSNVEQGYHFYINKNFHFVSNHTYKIETKLKWLNNTSNQDGAKAFFLGIGKFVKSNEVSGYSIYWHNSDKVYRNGLGISYANSGDVSTEKIISDQVTGLTNEYYLTIFSNIRAYQRRMTNAQIYYVKITDVTTDTVICNLVPKYNATRNVYYMQDTIDDSIYQPVTLGSNMRETSDLTIYPNET